MSDKNFCIRRCGNWHAWILVKMSTNVYEWKDDESERNIINKNKYIFSKSECESLIKQYGGNLTDVIIHNTKG